MSLSPGAVFAFAVDAARRGLGQVVAVDGDAVGVALCGAVWECDPLLDDIAEAPIGLHITVPAARLADVTSLGARSIVEDHALGPVVDAPLSVLMGALL